MGYLVCDKCKGYYKLKPGEFSTDFSNKCSCGGNLKFAYEKTGSDVNKKKKRKYTKKLINNKFYLVLILIAVLMVVFASAVYVMSLSATKPVTVVNVDGDEFASTSSQSQGSDYNSGYDEGYFTGVNDAYAGEDYSDGISTTINVSEFWKQGYKEGYNQGYYDLKSNKPLKKPKVSGTAILDPRTNEKIYS